MHGVRGHHPHGLPELQRLGWWGVKEMADPATGEVVGVARAVSDFAYCCYLSDLAVAADHQGRGIGRRLIEETRAAAGPQSMCLLVAAPKAVSFYESIGMPRVENAFIYRPGE